MARRSFFRSPWCVTLALFALAATAATARYSSPTLLYETPTADVLPAGALAISASGTYPLTKTSDNVNYLEADASGRFSPLKHLDFAVTAYTFKDYVLDVKYKVLGDDPDRVGLAVGVYDIGFNSYVSPIGHDTADAWPDWKYSHRPTERFSAYAVTSIPVTQFVRLHLGLGRGRFVGYGDHGKYLNTDILFNDYHQWAFGLFGGVEVYVRPQVALVAEASGRDVNMGVKADFGPVSVTAAGTKMEDLILSGGTAGFTRLELGVTYRLNLWRPAPAVMQPVEPFSDPAPKSEP